jgi:ABC-type branched-subunit amino acid transport system substrate-binding protein
MATPLTSARGALPWVALLNLSISAIGCATSIQPKGCASDAECGAGLVCSSDGVAGTCSLASQAPLRIGMSAPLTGPSQELGIEMKKGVTLAFDEVNAEGGIHGRRVELELRDDQYQPASAEAAAKSLLAAEPLNTQARCPTTSTPVVAGDQPVSETALARGPSAVLGLVGSVGTPTMVRSAPIAVETGSLFFGAFTGAAKVLRDGLSGPCGRFIFNVRASYAQEARATLEHFKKLRVPDARHVISFDQNDSFGQSGYDGLVAAYTALYGPLPTTIPRFRYTRDDNASVPAQVAATTAYLEKLMSADSAPHVVGVLMTDTYGPAATYIKGIRDWQYGSPFGGRLTLYFSNVSFVGPDALAVRLKDAGSVANHPYSENVFVSQVVPNYRSDASDGVQAYLRALAATGQTPSFTSLEGYLAGRVFVAGLAAHDGPFSPDALVSTYEHLPPLNLGLGASAGFTPQDHNYSKSVFGTALRPDGSFSNTYVWSEGQAIQLFE